MESFRKRNRKISPRPGEVKTCWWLRPHISIAGATGSMPALGTNIPHAPWCSQKKKKNLLNVKLRGWYLTPPLPISTTLLVIFLLDEEKVETLTDFIFLGSKITTDHDCGCEIKRRLLLGRKAMTNLDSVLKLRDIALPTKVCIFKAMVFPAVMYVRAGP